MTAPVASDERERNVSAPSQAGSPLLAYVAVPGWLLARQPSASAVVVYAHLAMFGIFNPDNPDGITYDLCQPGIKALTSGDPSLGYPGTGMSAKTVRRALAELEALGAIEWEAVHDDRRGRLPNIYRVHVGAPRPHGGATGESQATAG